MTTAAPSTALATIQPAFTDPERLALAGFLAGTAADPRRLRTRSASIRHLVPHPIPALFAVRRADIEGFAGTWKPEGGARATSPGGCPPLPGSTGTPSRRNSWTTPGRPRPAAPAGL